jgi:soluble lytic murein transglycosylase-like protein
MLEPTGANCSELAVNRLLSRVACLALALLAAAAGYAQSHTRATDARSGPDPELRTILLGAIAEADSFDDRFDAEVWLTDMSRRLARQVPDAAERLQILKAVHKHATHAQVEPELVLAVMDVESFDRFAISSASALGLMQVMPFCAGSATRTRTSYSRST